MAIANLIEKKWLWRSFHVVTDDGVFEVIYDGKGTGYEEVLVDGEIACRMSSVLWYNPNFDFNIGSENARINVKISPLLQITSFELNIDGTAIYSE